MSPTALKNVLQSLSILNCIQIILVFLFMPFIYIYEHEHIICKFIYA